MVDHLYSRFSPDDSGPSAQLADHVQIQICGDTRARQDDAERAAESGLILNLLEAPGVGAASREHLRIEGPAGMLIDDVDLYDMESDPEVRQSPIAAKDHRTFENA